MGKTRDRQMKIIFLTSIMVASLLLCGCAGEQPPEVDIAEAHPCLTQYQTVSF